MASLSDSDDNGDLSSWTEVDPSPKGNETNETDASCGFKGAVVYIDEAAGGEKLGSSGSTSEAGAAPDAAAATGHQLFQMSKEIGVIQHSALEV